MSNAPSPARRYYDTIVELRTGKITADDYRATMRALMDELGEAGYQRAKVAALGFDINVNG